MMTDTAQTGQYPFEWSAGPVRRIALAPVIRGVVDDIRQGMPAFVIGARFHNTVIDGCARLCAAIAADYQLKRVVLSGGCFQNRILLEGLTRTLEHSGLEVFNHRQVPANDGGIALGQAVIGAARALG